LIPLFIHIGDENVIRSEEVIAILDYSLFHSSTIIQELIFKQREKGNVIDSDYEEAKSIVITIDKIYFSSLSVPTLNRRSHLSYMLENVDDTADIKLTDETTD